MGDAQSEGEGPRCVGCGRRVKTLFVQYSPGNIRLMKCDSCKAVADPYIECEFMIILIDLILHKTSAYRHLLFNKLSTGSSVDKGMLYWYTLMHIALDAFRLSFSEGNRADGASSTSILSTVFNCSEVVGSALLGNIIFMIMLFLGVRFILKLSYNMTSPESCHAVSKSPLLRGLLHGTHGKTPDGEVDPWDAMSLHLPGASSTALFNGRTSTPV